MYMKQQPQQQQEKYTQALANDTHQAVLSWYFVLLRTRYRVPYSFLLLLMYECVPVRTRENIKLCGAIETIASPGQVLLLYEDGHGSQQHPCTRGESCTAAEPASTGIARVEGSSEQVKGIAAANKRESRKSCCIL